MKFFSFYIPTVVFSAINLLVLYMIMKKILFTPIINFVENRKKLIKDSLDHAEHQKNEAEALRKDYEEQLKAARMAAEKIVEDSRVKAEKQHELLTQVARQEAEEILVKAQEEIQIKKEQMLKELKAEVAGLALAAASKVIEANMDNDKNRRLVDKFLDEAGAA
ncbi:MAG: F0F1 ATP synthase subunit B [Eubacteriaceae bacterium]|nr:F0F1 ATP synthase subunit B [Eubacteriaceae bacterium]